MQEKRPTFEEEAAAYREGAWAYNKGLSFRDNPYKNTGLATPWRMGFLDRKEQVAHLRQRRCNAPNESDAPNNAE